MRIVERGAQFLDEAEPGWVDRIDLDELDLGSGCNCVLGQLYLSEHPRTRNKWDAYSRKAEELGIDPDSYQAARLGFMEWGRARFDNMTAAWRREIQKRRAKS